MSRIAIVGATTVDVILEVERFPAEDDELRAVARRVAVGGNAANSARVLAGLGHQVDLVTALGEDEHAALVRETLAAAGVGLRFVPPGQAGPTPLSTILLNRTNGSRTIVHHRGLAELSLAELTAVELEGVDWLHLEARDVTVEAAWLREVRARHARLPVSLEIEKNRPAVESLLAYADLVVLARRLAAERQVADAAALLEHFRARASGAELVCPWGELGAWALTRAGELVHQPACPPPRVVDTLGAGDVFNAGLIDARCRGLSLTDALAAACRLAGRKVGQVGFAGLS